MVLMQRQSTRFLTLPVLLPFQPLLSPVPNSPMFLPMVSPDPNTANSDRAWACLTIRAEEKWCSGGFGIFYNEFQQLDIWSIPSADRPDVNTTVSASTPDNGVTAPYFLSTGLP